VITVSFVRRRWTMGLLVALTAATTLSSAGVAGAASGPAVAPAAVGVWSASLEGVHGVSPDATVRQIARVSVSGSGIRVRLGNPFGATPVVIREAWLGRPVAPGA
jgi:hypothetical protein